jgi:APA family basic amino acid/polyamine antiporter
MSEPKVITTPLKRTIGRKVPLLFVDGPSFRVRTWVPVVGALVWLVLASPVTGRDADVYERAGLLLGIGVVLYGINRLVVGTGEPDAGRLSG